MKVEVGGKIVDLPNDYVPSLDEEYMNEKQRAFFKVKLQNWLDDIKTKLKAEYLDDVNGDYRSVDEQDIASMEANALTELRSKDRLRKLAYKIEENIKKIDMDTYGFCEESGNEIGINRLMLRPIARYCVEIQERKDKAEAELELLERYKEQGDDNGDDE